MMPDPHSLTFKRAGLDDREALRLFYQRLYRERARYKYPERWLWILDGARRVEGDVPFFVACRNGEIVGHSGVINNWCWVQGEKRKIGWNIDFHVNKEERGQGIGVALQRMNVSDNDIFASIAMTPPNESIQIKLGAQKGPPAFMLCKMFRLKGQARAALSVYGRMRWLVFLFSFFPFSVYRLSLLAGARVKVAPVPAVSVLYSDAEFGEEDDLLWQSVKGRYDFAADRSSDYLNWRYRDQPWTQYACARVYGDGGDLLCLVVYRLARECDPPVLVIDEIICRSESSELVSYVIEALERKYRATGIGQVHVGSSEKYIVKALRRMGYLYAEARPLVANGAVISAAGISANSKVLVSKGDQDWDQFPRCRIYDFANLLRRHLSIYRNTVGNGRDL